MLSKKEILHTFLDLVKIDSPSGEEQKVGDYIIKYLKKIKVKAWRDSYGNVIAKIPGYGQPLLLNSHMDTVEPGQGVKPIIRGGVIKSDGKTVLGADPKVGLTAILTAVKYIVAKKLKHQPLELVFTKEEEKDLKGVINLNFKKLKAKRGILLDYDLPLGKIFIASPYIYLINIKITGRAAHAGSDPEKGINAIEIAAKAISELKIGRINKNTTNNIGVIQGGTADSTVPEVVTIKGEARSHNLAEAQQQVDFFGRAFKKYVRRYGAKLLFQTKLACQGYSYSPHDTFIKEIAAVNKKLGYQTEFLRTTAASDANIFAAKKIKVITISDGSFYGHTTREMVRISTLVDLTKFIIEFVKIK
jgi:tripeptide aminopeptidase